MESPGKGCRGGNDAANTIAHAPASGSDVRKVAQRMKAQRIIFLSAHYDDAALGCGGLISALRDSAQTEIWTLFTSAPLFGPYSGTARWLHHVTGAKGRALARIRQREDMAACRVLGAEFHHFSWKDAAYRKHAGEFLYADTQQAACAASDLKLVDEIAAQLRRRLTERDILVIPLVGEHHVDHMIARLAGERTGHQQICFYPDPPYRWNDGLDASGSSLEHSYQRYDLN